MSRKTIWNCPSAFSISNIQMIFADMCTCRLPSSKICQSCRENHLHFALQSSNVFPWTFSISSTTFVIWNYKKRLLSYKNYTWLIFLHWSCTILRYRGFFHLSFRAIRYVTGLASTLLLIFRDWTFHDSREFECASLFFSTCMYIFFVYSARKHIRGRSMCASWSAQIRFL